MINRIIMWPYLAIRSARVQSLVLSLFAAVPVLVWVLDRMMTARFTALVGHAPNVANYAASPVRAEVNTFCEPDRFFALCATPFRDEDLFTGAWAGFIMLLIMTLILSVSEKQKRFTLHLSAMMVAYVLLLATMDYLTPLSQYYLIQCGDLRRI